MCSVYFVCVYVCVREYVFTAVVLILHLPIYDVTSDLQGVWVTIAALEGSAAQDARGHRGHFARPPPLVAPRRRRQRRPRPLSKAHVRAQHGFRTDIAALGDHLHRLLWRRVCAGNCADTTGRLFFFFFWDASAVPRAGGAAALYSFPATSRYAAESRRPLEPLPPLRCAVDRRQRC